MPFQLDWEYEDDNGVNPLGKPGNLSFDIEFEFDPGAAPVLYLQNGDGDPGEPPSVTFTNACCTAVDFYNNGPAPRIPTVEEKETLEPWFLDELDRDARLQQRIKNACRDLVNFEADWDDLDD